MKSYQQQTSHANYSSYFLCTHDPTVLRTCNDGNYSQAINDVL